MFSRVFALIPLALLVFAAPPSSSMCTTGSPMCCQKSGPSNSSEIQNEISSWSSGNVIGPIVASVGALVGLDCVGIVGNGAGCSQSPLCCQRNMDSDTLIGLDCTPITVGL